ncbi:MAG: anthranilate phosphoribosyltransferase [Deltaproteobacteria bacterium]|nr:anthranilate phosphoribosyltransferase [Deltaproteobacteria bacterium]
MSVVAATEIAVRGDEVPIHVLEAAFGEIMDGKATPVGIAALLVALRTKGETAGELVAVARALRSRAVQAPLHDARTVDTCGTGGDGAGTFNISTTAAFVVAGAGVPVAKHGNRAATSRAGSFDVLEALGVEIELSVEAAARVLDQIGIAPFFARIAHPAMRFVAPVRRELGVRTLMNWMGPLLSPVGVRRQVIGVGEPALCALLGRVLFTLGTDAALLVHGSDGLDEITITGPTHAVRVGGACGEGRAIEIDPQRLGLTRGRSEDLRGGDASENAAILRSILAGEKGPRRDIVCLNAAAALWIADAAPSLEAGLAQAAESIDSGAAKAKLEALVRATQAARTEARG